MNRHPSSKDKSCSSETRFGGVTVVDARKLLGNLQVQQLMTKVSTLARGMIQAGRAKA